MTTLGQRMNEARDGWRERAQEALDEQIDPEMLADIRTRAEAALEISKSSSTPSKASTISISILDPPPICLRPIRPIMDPSLSSPAT